MLAVQTDGRAERARWLRVDQGSTPFTMPTFPLFQMFSSQQTFTEYLLCTRYVLGTWGRGDGEQRGMNCSTFIALRGSWSIAGQTNTGMAVFQMAKGFAQ